MATIAANPKTRKASELLDRYAELYQEKLHIEESAKQAKAPLEEELTELKGKLEKWSLKNADLFGGKKTMALDGGTFGHKLNAKAVSFHIDSPDDIRDKYFAIVKAELPTAIVESVDSKKVIGGWDHVPTLAKKLEKLGITIAQEDSFFITPKK